jgi:hypothetical protein
METPEQSGTGYPEDAPEEVADDAGAKRDRSSGGGRSKEPDSEPDKATGNPNAAGG